MTSSRAAWPYFRRIENKVREHLMVLYLDAANMPIAMETVHVGTLSQTPPDPGEILRTALHIGAIALIVGHNHPSGNPRPSLGDHNSLQLLRDAARLVGVQILDSLIIIPGFYYSLQDAESLERSLSWKRVRSARRGAATRAARREATPAPAPDAAPAVAPAAQGA